jgi:hypothetical protein
LESQVEKLEGRCEEYESKLEERERRREEERERGSGGRRGVDPDTSREELQELKATNTKLSLKLNQLHTTLDTLSQVHFPSHSPLLHS